MELAHHKILDPPEVENYSDYRKFLRDYYSYRKSLRSTFSFRQFAAKAGIKSPNYLQLVMQGKRNLSVDMARKVAKSMELSQPEVQLFVSLVKRGAAKNEKEQGDAERERLIALRHLCATRLPKTQTQVLEKWFYMVVRELVVFNDFEPKGQWISERLNGVLSPEESEEAFQFLHKNKFVEFREGRWHQSDGFLTTGEAFGELLICNHHMATLKNWVKSIDKYHVDEREMGLLNIPISEKNVPKLQEKLRDFQNELVGWLKDEEDIDQVVQVGFYMMPVTKKTPAKYK